MPCDAPHPLDPTRRCERIGSPGHQDHMDSKGAPWTTTVGAVPTPEVRLPKPDRALRSTVIRNAADASRSRRTSGFSTNPNARNSDPATSHEAAAQYEAIRTTVMGRVLLHLQANLGEWVDAEVLQRKDIGGMSGTRRMRDLRADGWPIETRKKPDVRNVWQHRLTGPWDISLRQRKQAG